MIIFDFDLTLVDTHPVAELRAARKWREVMGYASALHVYDGIHELLRELHARNRKLGIVTKSPDMVPWAFIRQYNWPIHIVIGYHQVKRRKPDPEALLLAMAQGADPEMTFHVGDQAEDTEASRAANVAAVGAGWGNGDVGALVDSKPDYLFTSVEELRKFFR